MGPGSKVLYLGAASGTTVSHVADIVGEVVPNTKVTYSETSSPDARNYRVNCDKIARTLPEFKPQWTVRKGVEQLYEAYSAPLSQAATANLNPWTEVKVDTDNPDRC